MPTTEYAQALLLAALAPDDAPVYFALFLDAEAELELDVPGYERVEYLGGWLTVGATRANASPVAWPPLEAPAMVRSAGFFDAPVGGNLLGYARTLTLQAQETDVAIEAGDVCELPVGAVRLLGLPSF